MNIRIETHVKVRIPAEYIHLFNSFKDIRDTKISRKSDFRFLVLQSSFVYINNTI